jgi:hypothetical protein
MGIFTATRPWLSRATCVVGINPVSRVLPSSETWYAPATISAVNGLFATVPILSQPAWQVDDDHADGVMSNRAQAAERQIRQAFFMDASSAAILLPDRSSGKVKNEQRTPATGDLK